MSEVAVRLERLRASLRDACRAAGRPEDSVELLAVSKLQPSPQAQGIQHPVVYPHG